MNAINLHIYLLIILIKKFLPVEKSSFSYWAKIVCLN